MLKTMMKVIDENELFPFSLNFFENILAFVVNLYVYILQFFKLLKIKFYKQYRKNIMCMNNNWYVVIFLNSIKYKFYKFVFYFYWSLASNSFWNGSLPIYLSNILSASSSTADNLPKPSSSTKHIS